MCILNLPFLCLLLWPTDQPNNIQMKNAWNQSHQMCVYICKLKKEYALNNDRAVV